MARRAKLPWANAGRNRTTRRDRLRRSTLARSLLISHPRVRPFLAESQTLTAPYRPLPVARIAAARSTHHARRSRKNGSMAVPKNFSGAWVVGRTGVADTPRGGAVLSAFGAQCPSSDWRVS